MKRFIYVYALTLCSGILHAGPSDRIDDLVSEIVSDNIGLKVSEKMVESEKNAMLSSNNLSDPQLEFSHQWGQFGIGNKWSVGVSQSFEWPGVYSSRNDMMRSRQASLDILQKIKIHELRLNARKAILENIYLKQMASLRRDQLTRIDSLISVYQKGIEQGEISILDLNKLKIERVNVQRNLVDVINQLNGNIEALTTMNGGERIREKLELINDYPDSELLPLDDYINSAMQNDPSLSYNMALGQSYMYESRVLNRSLIPGFSLGYTHDYELGEHFNGISFGLTLPIFSTRHKKKEIDHKSIANTLEISDKETEIRSYIRKTYALIVGLNKELDDYGKALFNIDNFRLLDIALSAGHITLVEYLTQSNYFNDASEGYISLSYQRAVAFAELNQWNN